MINWKQLNKDAVVLFATGKVNELIESENFGIQFEVGDEMEHSTVTIHNTGRMRCTCKKNIYIPEYMCKHKLAVILHTQRKLFK